MTTYKHIGTGVVISETDYNRLPSHKQRDYYRSYESVTHGVEEDSSGDFITTLLIAEAVMGLMDSDSSPSIDFAGTVDTPESNDVDFGGGDFGGGGGGSEW